MRHKIHRLQFAILCVAISVFSVSQPAASQKVDVNLLLSQSERLISFDQAAANAFALVENGRVVPIYVAAENPETVKVAAAAFAGDLESVTGTHAQVLASLTA